MHHLQLVNLFADGTSITSIPGSSNTDELNSTNELNVEGASLGRYLQYHSKRPNRSNGVVTSSGGVSASGGMGGNDIHYPLSQLLAHPVCIELVKDELLRSHSVENLLFWIDVQRFKRLKSYKLKRMIGMAIYRYFILENSECQINVSNRLRDHITDELSLPHSKQQQLNENTLSELFSETEAEVLKLMETNLRSSFTDKSENYKLCVTILKTQQQARRGSMGSVGGTIGEE